MAQFGEYNDKQLEKIAKELFDRLEDGNVKEEFDLVSTSDLHVKLTDKQLTITGKQIINGNEYQPIKQRVRRYDDEYTFELLAVSYLMIKLFADGTKE